MSDQQAASQALSDAWDALYDSLPPRWHIGRPSYDSDRQAWSVTAWGPLRKSQDTVVGVGDDDVAALRDLDRRLRRRLPRPNTSRAEEFRQQLRMAYVHGAEAFAREAWDRGLSSDELERVIARFAGFLR